MITTHHPCCCTPPAAADQQYGFVEELPDETISLLEARMRPGRSSAAGFLGAGESLRRVCQEDQETLQARGISYEQIAALLEDLISSDLSERLQDKPSPCLGGRFRVFSEPSFGFQYCPFFVEDPGGCAKGNANHRVTRIEDGETLTFSDLHVHLIRKHHFFEGKETEYRLDPEAAITFFAMQPPEDAGS